MERQQDHRSPWDEPLDALPSAQKGRPARYDYEYERNGTANLFMMFAPLEGWRHVKVTDRHTAVDYAHVLKEVGHPFPDAEKIILVQDNLNTHTPASLYEAFPADEARRLVERFEWHYTPKHGSWLNLANPNWVFSRPNASIAGCPTNGPQERARCLGGQPQQETHQGQLAFHNAERTCQTQEPLPFVLTDSDD
jgi:hypothetical protein